MISSVISKPLYFINLVHNNNWVIHNYNFKSCFLLSFNVTFGGNKVTICHNSIYDYPLYKKSSIVVDQWILKICMFINSFNNSLLQINQVFFRCVKMINHSYFLLILVKISDFIHFIHMNNHGKMLMNPFMTNVINLESQCWA